MATPKPITAVEDLALSLAEAALNGMTSTEARLLREVSQLKQDLVHERMRLFACSVTALGNTPVTVAQRIARDHSYWSAAYGHVCAAVDREIALRADVAQLQQERDGWKLSYETAQDHLAALTAALEVLEHEFRHDPMGRGTYVADRLWALRTPEAKP